MDVLCYRDIAWVWSLWLPLPVEHPVDVHVLAVLSMQCNFKVELIMQLLAKQTVWQLSQWLSAGVHCCGFTGVHC